MIARCGAGGGLSAADLNYPDHFDHHTPAELSRLLADQGMALNGLAMRYYTEAGFRLGAFTHPDAARAPRGDRPDQTRDRCLCRNGRAAR